MADSCKVVGRSLMWPLPTSNNSDNSLNVCRGSKVTISSRFHLVPTNYDRPSTTTTTNSTSSSTASLPRQHTLRSHTFCSETVDFPKLETLKNLELSRRQNSSGVRASSSSERPLQEKSRSPAQKNRVCHIVPTLTGTAKTARNLCETNGLLNKDETNKIQQGYSSEVVITSPEEKQQPNLSQEASVNEDKVGLESREDTTISSKFVRSSTNLRLIQMQYQASSESADVMQSYTHLGPRPTNFQNGFQKIAKGSQKRRRPLVGGHDWTGRDRAGKSFTDRNNVPTNSIHHAIQPSVYQSLLDRHTIRSGRRLERSDRLQYISLSDRNWIDILHAHPWDSKLHKLVHTPHDDQAAGSGKPSYDHQVPAELSSKSHSRFDEISNTRRPSSSVSSLVDKTLGRLTPWLATDKQQRTKVASNVERHSQVEKAKISRTTESVRDVPANTPCTSPTHDADNHHNYNCNVLPDDGQLLSLDDLRAYPGRSRYFRSPVDKTCIGGGRTQDVKPVVAVRRLTHRKVQSPVAVIIPY